MHAAVTTSKKKSLPHHRDHGHGMLDTYTTV
jgi:hypothetical protein